MKIETTAKIEKCEIKSKSTGLKFGELRLSSAQIEQIAELVKGEEVVNITIEPVQEQLPGFEVPPAGAGEENSHGSTELAEVKGAKALRKKKASKNGEE